MGRACALPSPKVGALVPRSSPRCARVPARFAAAPHASAGRSSAPASTSWSRSSPCNSRVRAVRAGPRSIGVDRIVAELSTLVAFLAPELKPAARAVEIETTGRTDPMTTAPTTTMDRPNGSHTTRGRGASPRSRRPTGPSPAPTREAAAPIVLLVPAGMSSFVGGTSCRLAADHRCVTMTRLATGSARERMPRASPSPRHPTPSASRPLDLAT